MNIATSNATTAPVPLKADPSAGPTRGAPGSDDGSVDPSAESDASAPQGFGQILSNRMATDGVDDTGRSKGPRDTIAKELGDLALKTAAPLEVPATAANSADASSKDATLAALAAATQDLSASANFHTLKTTSDGSSTKATDKTTSDTKQDDDDAVGNDLAAQLALVSQWASIARPVVPAGTTTPADASTAAVASATSSPGIAQALDIKAKLDAIRTPTGKDDAALAKSTTTAEQTAVTVVPAALTTGAPSLGKDARATSSFAVTKADELKARDDANSTLADKTATLDALFGKTLAAAQTGASDTNAIGTAFVTQIASHASGTQAAVNVAASLGSDTLREQVGTSGWSHEVGQATLRMAANDLQTASLRLNPEHLGPLDVQVRIDNGVAHLSFNAAHADTRQALESSRTTLDQMFSDQGLKIGDCAVGGSSADASSARNFGADAAQADASRRDSAARAAASSASAGNDGPASTITTRVTRALGLVDTFA
jgi:flagellar hook-length control protein FliK